MVLVAVAAILLGACNGSAGSSSPAAGPSAQPTLSPPVAAASPAPSASIAPSAPPSLGPAALVPAAPSDTTFKHLKDVVAANGTTTQEYKATWTEPEGAATEFRVYGVTDCLRDSQENDNTPCVITGTEIPASKLKLIETASGTARTIGVIWTLEGEAGPGPYQAVVIVALNKAGPSSPAVVWSALVCHGCVT
jgi:hypothetical protein